MIDLRHEHERKAAPPERREPCRFEGPSVRGPCEAVDVVGPCLKEGRVRYFVAVKLPRTMHLCDDHYLWLRRRLERWLSDLIMEWGELKGVLDDLRDVEEIVFSEEAEEDG